MKKKMNNMMLSIVADYLLILILLISGLTSKAQETNTEEKRCFQLGFITPLGSNGLESGKITNQISFNMLVGYAGGLDGVELGGFYNILNGNMKGVQIAGFGNTSLGTTKGVQLAGFVNTNLKAVDAVQMAGFANLVNDSVEGAQLSGFTNVVNGNVTGFQSTGFVNVVNGDVTGTQISGFANLNNGNVDGIQLSGFSNIANGKLKGLQLSGFANIATKDVKGAQISGFFNYAKTLKGIQLGIINISDSLSEGLPIGLINIVKKNGYFALQFSAEEVMHGQLNYKMGVEQFYTIFKLGYSYQEEASVLSYGLGFGTLLPLAEKHQIAFEVSTSHLNKDKTWDEDLDILSQLNISYQFKITKNLSITAGPSLNFYSTNQKTNDEYGIIELPYTLHEYENRGHMHSLWIGFNAGLVFKI